MPMPTINYDDNPILNMAKTIAIYFSLWFFIILPVAPIKIIGNMSILPNISIIIFYYVFAIKHEHKHQFLILFILGVLFDIYNILPIGYTSFVWLISFALNKFIISILRTSNTVFSYFFKFCIFEFMSTLLNWIILIIIAPESASFLRLFWRFIVDILFFLIMVISIERFKKVNKKR